MKLSWRDFINTVLAIAGGVIVYAKFYDYNWAFIGSWRNSVVALAIIGLAMFLVSGFDFANRSILNIAEMIIGVAALALAIWGVIVTSSTLFYVFAAVLGSLWLIDTARHAYHSIGGESTTYHHLPAH